MVKRDGSDGEDGRDVEDGRDGEDGMDGRDGEDGSDGEDGMDGSDGEDGRDGVDGIISAILSKKGATQRSTLALTMTTVSPWLMADRRASMPPGRSRWRLARAKSAQRASKRSMDMPRKKWAKTRCLAR